MISLRLTPDLENKLNKIAKDEKKSKPEIVKQAIISYIEKYDKKKRPYELGKDVFGKYGSGNKNLSKDYKKILKERLHEK